MSSEKSGKTVLVDELIAELRKSELNGGGGHHLKYMMALLGVEGTEPYIDKKSFTSYKKNPVKSIKERLSYFDKIPPAHNICLLYLDNHYFFPFIFRKLNKKCDNLIGVLHWFPKSKILISLLRLTSKKMSKIVVHSDYIRRQCSDAGISNAVTIDYPVICDVDCASLIRNDSHGKKVFVCLGGSRTDKGPDVLNEAFDYIDDNVCGKIKILVAGKELDFPYSEIAASAHKKNIEIEFINKRLSDEEYWQCVIDADVILLPYKRIFTGNSGPMTDGVSQNKYILGPDEGNLGYFINKYHLGSTFKIENPQSLGKEISRVALIDTTCSHKYREKLEVSDFRESYRALFESLD